MPATLKLRDKVYEVPAGMTVRDALIRLAIEPESVLPTRDGQLITDDRHLQEGEVIRLVAVISGGAQDTDGARPRGPR
ncbi:MAG TPA: MoaD/ThiS family protein [Anaerolineales bacterium]|nr:MoaD/ThiS family protein [Anaerolineales bacterium]